MIRQLFIPLLLGALTIAPAAATIAPAAATIGPATATEHAERAGVAADIGMSEAVLRSGVTLFEEAVDRDDLKGAVLLVARRGHVVLHQAVGWRNQEQGLAMEKDTLFRMASNTKPVIATAVLMLAVEGKLRLDQNVRDFFPSWDNHRAAFIQIRHLLSHTSGLRISTLFLEPLLEPSPEHPGAPSLQLEVARFGEVGAEYPPGATYSYNNPGFNTLGGIIEVASGRPLRDFLRERIYQPLGMTDSFNHELDAPQSRMARVYRRRRAEDRRGADDPPGAEWTIQWTPGDPPDVPFVRASGGMISSAADYFRFCQMFLEKGSLGGVKILAPESIAAATRIQSDEAWPIEARAGIDELYGYGWAVDRAGVFSHGGSDGTFAWVDPGREIVGLVFTQSPGGKIPTGQFRRVVEASIVDE